MSRPARGRARVPTSPPSGVHYYGEVRAGADVYQAGNDINYIERAYNAPDYYEHAKRFCSLAVAAFLLALMFWPAAIPVGHAARRRIRRTGEGGWGLATAALVISWSIFFVTATAVAVVAIVVQSRGPVSGGLPDGHAAVRDQQIRISDDHGWPEFTPGSATLGAGSTVTWVNERVKKCRLVATNDELPQGTGANPIRQGNTYRITFTEPGMYGFACDGDPASGGTIVID
ncbi:DUF4190 domain-containing protein [Krasilnikovia sp. MM14-A1259]|uniref:DUF4190 domain-containing protein n=1 Tax=Krasilnikovia sp. MM14-A1259 TaxID=3373539 RepID=UPI0037F94767